VKRETEPRLRRAGGVYRRRYLERSTPTPIPLPSASPPEQAVEAAPPASEVAADAPASGTPADMSAAEVTSEPHPGTYAADTAATTE
jgi:hypothetical protein